MMLLSNCCCTVEDGTPPFCLSSPDHLESMFYQAVRSAGGADANESSSPPGQHCRRPQQAFTVTLRRDSIEIPWGLRLDLADNRTIHVCGILESIPVLHYNSRAKDDRKLKSGDYIVEANGFSATANLDGRLLSQVLEGELQRASIAVLAVRRPQFFDCTIEKGDGPLGLDLNYTGHCTSLIISNILPGAVQKSAPEVCAGDRIVAVNGVVGQACTLLEALKASKKPVLTISRPTPRVDELLPPLLSDKKAET